MYCVCLTGTAAADTVIVGARSDASRDRARTYAFYSAVSTHPTAPDARLQINMGVHRDREDQFQTVRGSKTSELRKHKVVLDVENILKSTLTGAHSWTSRPTTMLLTG